MRQRLTNDFKSYGPELILDASGCDVSLFTKEKIHQYFREVCKVIAMKRFGMPMFWIDKSDHPHLRGISAVQFIETSSITVHAAEIFKTIFINIFSCKGFDSRKAEEFTKKYFKARIIQHVSINRQYQNIDNPNVILKRCSKRGKGVFAKSKIRKGEFIAMFDGEIYDAKTAMDVPTAVRDYVIQFSRDRWRDSRGIARYLNHSCEPNCGIKKLFQIIAMRDIRKGEELTWDYDTSEDSNWKMKCKCGSKSCRGIIRGYRFLPKSKTKEYRGYISNWLVK